MFYLARIIGSGTEEDPFRPSGRDVDRRTPMIDLRPDSRVADGFALVKSTGTLPDSTERFALGDDSGARLSQRIRDGIQNRLSLNLDDEPLRRLIASLLIVHGDDMNPGRWNRLRPMRHAWRVYLGGLLYETPVIQGGATFTDDFNRTDSTDLGVNWDDLGGDTQIVSNELKFINGSGTNLVRATTVMDTDDHFAEAILTNAGGGSVSTRQNTPSPDTAANATFYMWRWAPGASAWQLWKSVTGTLTNISGDITTPAFSAPDTIRLEVDGSTQECFVNAVSLHSATDTAISGNLKVGARRASTADATLDDYSAGDLGAAAITGTIAQTLPALTQAAAGSVEILATSAQTLPALTQSAAGEVEVFGSVESTLPALTQAAAGETELLGTVAQTLAALTQAVEATNDATIRAAVDFTLPAFTQAAAGSIDNSGLVDSVASFGRLRLGTLAELTALETQSFGAIRIDADVDKPLVGASFGGART